MKGMQAISRGSGFGGLAKYGMTNASGEVEGRIIGGNMSGTTAEELTKEFGLSRKVRPDIKKPVWHNSLRSPKDEKLTDEQFNAFADDYMKRMGFTDAHQRVYMMHDDEDGRHIHIEASRIGLDGTIYYGKNENLKSSRIINRLEKVHGIEQTKGPNVKGELVIPDVKRPTFGEVGKFKRTGETPDREALAKLIDQAIADKPSASVFAERLVLAGIEVRANFGKGELNGFSFKINDTPFKGSQLGKQYTGQALLSRGLTYVADRDYETLRAIAPASRGPELHDRVAKGVDGIQPGSANRASDSTAARDADAVRRADRRADRPGAGTPAADDPAGPGRGERDERIDRESEHAAESVDESPGSRREGVDVDQRAESGAERPACPGATLAPAREHSHQSHDVGHGIATGVEVSSSGLITTGDKAIDELLQAAHSGRLKAEREVLSRQKKQHAEDMANSKKRQIELDKPASNRLSQLADRNIDSAWRAVEMQRFASAMGAGKFQVTCTPANAKAETIKHVYSAQDLQDPKVIKNLSHLSARNYTVSVQPSDSAGLIMLKGLDANDIKKMEAIGLAPAAVVSFAGKHQAWISTGSQMSADERKALTKRIEAMVGVDKAAGMSGRLVGFSGAGLTAGTGQVAPAAAELLGEIKAEIFEAKAKALLASAIEKTLVIGERDFVDVGGKHLRKGLLRDACRSALNDQSMFFAGKYDSAVVEQGVLEAMARQGVKPSQAYHAVFDDSPVAAGDERHAADAVAQAFTRVALVKEGKDLAGIDVAKEAAKRHPELMKRAESRQDSEVKAYDAQVKASGEAESKRMAKDAELERIAKAKAFEAAERIAKELGGTIKPDD